MTKVLLGPSFNGKTIFTIIITEHEMVTDKVTKNKWVLEYSQSTSVEVSAQDILLQHTGYFKELKEE